MPCDGEPKAGPAKFLGGRSVSLAERLKQAPNLILIHANSPDDAYEQALSLGRSGDTEYLNPAGKLVTSRFRGLSFLDVIHDPLEHGAELMFQSNVGITPDNLQKLLLSKEELPLFRPITRLDGPDVASGEVVHEIEERFGIKRPV